MLVNKQFYMISNDWQIWEKVARLFSDYARLKKRHTATDAEWKLIVQERISKVILEREILVGDRTNPEKRYLVTLHGNGNMFIGSNIDNERARIIHQYTDVFNTLQTDALVKHKNNEFIMMHYDMELIGSEFKKDLLKVVDISTFDPFMLVLTESGDVIEFIFKPSWDTKWDEFTKPRLLNFPKNVQIEKIYAMDYAFMAIEKGYVWVWSIIDNPLGDENIRTPPTLIEALKNMFVYYVELMGLITRIYYVSRDIVNKDNMLKFRSPYKEDIVDPDAIYVDIENIQVMQIIAMSVFTEQQIQQIAEKVRTAEDA